jgi:hypothetical protein
MATTWFEFKELLSEKLTMDGNVAYDISHITFDTTYCKRARRYFSIFCRETYYFNVQLSPFTVGIGESEINLITKGTRVFAPTQLWLAGSAIPKTTPEYLVNTVINATIQSGQPSLWASPVHEMVSFNAIPAASVAGKVSGWADHPAIASNATVLSITDQHSELAMQYIVSLMTTFIAADKLGMDRSSANGKAAAAAMVAIRASNIARYYEELTTGYRLGN